MKKLLAVLVLIAAVFAVCGTPAYAVEPVMVAQGQHVTVRLFDRPCTNEVVLAQLKPSFHPKYRAGNAQLDGEHRELCWMILPGVQPVVFIVDDQGESADLDISNFKKDEGV